MCDLLDATETNQVVGGEVKAAWAAGCGWVGGGGGGGVEEEEEALRGTGVSGAQRSRLHGWCGCRRR